MSEKSVKIGKKTYTLIEKTDKLWALFDDGLKRSQNYDTLHGAKFELITVSPVINRRTVARVRTSSALLKLFNQCDFLIEMSEDYYNLFSDELKTVVFEHECCHCIGIEKNDESISYRTVDHNLKDFFSVVDKYGTKYLSEMMAAMKKNAIKQRQENKKNETPEDSEAAVEDELKSILV